VAWKLIISLFALTACYASGQAAIYWVSPTGVATYANCASANPLDGSAACSLATANTNAIPGDTIMMRGGTYNTAISPTNSGTSDSNVITYQAYSGDSTKPTITNIATGIILNGDSYIVIDGVTVTNTDMFLDMENSQHCAVQNSLLTVSRLNAQKSGYPTGIQIITNSHYNKLLNNTLSEVGYYDPVGNFSRGHIMQLGTEADPNDDTSYNLIGNNTYAHGGHDLLAIAGHHNIVKNNFFHNEDWSACGRTESGGLCGQRDLIIAADYPHAANNVLEGNIFSNAGFGQREGATQGFSLRTPYNIARNNLVYYNAGTGLYMYNAEPGYYDASHNYIYNNVYFHNGTMVSIDSIDSAGDNRNAAGIFFQMQDSGSPVITGNVVKNNIFFQNPYGSYGWSVAVQANQIIAGNFEQNNATTPNPMFVNSSGPLVNSNRNSFDFHLQAGSPAIDKGVFLTNTTSAGSGTLIPVADANYFINGYGIDTSDTIQLEGQTQAAHIVSINYTTNQITVDTWLTWSSNQGVSIPYSGNSPDPGAFEYGSSDGGTTEIFPSAAPTTFYDGSSPVELGVKFRSDLNGTITGIRFYKGLGDTSVHTGSL